MGRHAKPTPEKYCIECATKLERKRLPSGDLESLFHFNRRKFCDQACMAKDFDKRHKLDAGWTAAHRLAREIKAHGPCERCGKPNASDVHHRDGDFQNNVAGNLERICRSCHNKEHRPRGSCLICGEPVKGLGYCEKHYQRFKKWGDPLAVKINQNTPLGRLDD